MSRRCTRCGTYLDVGEAHNCRPAVPVRAGYRVCPTCGLNKRLADFPTSRNQNGKTYLNGATCRECYNISRKARAAELKELRTPAPMGYAPSAPGAFWRMTT